MTRWTLGALHSGVGVDVVDLFGVGVAVGRLVDPGLDFWAIIHKAWCNHFSHLHAAKQISTHR